MNPRFSIWIVKTEIYWHTHMVVGELAQSLQFAFKELGYGEIPIVDKPTDIKGWAVVLCTNFLTDIPQPLPEKLILFNLEQVQQDSPWMTQEHLDVFSRYPIWDYSKLNIDNLRKRGIVNTTLCSIGYAPVLNHIPDATENIDVLFYGSVNERRKVIFEELRARSVDVVVAEGVYGTELDDLISRAKIVLNVHYYEAKVFEIVRVSYLLANKKCIVSEKGGDESLEAPLKDGVAFVGYEDLVATCLDLLDSPEKREELAKSGYQAFQSISQSAALKYALDHTPELKEFI
jgi:hypothetical protein